MACALLAAVVLLASGAASGQQPSAGVEPAPSAEPALSAEQRPIAEPQSEGEQAGLDDSIEAAEAEEPAERSWIFGNGYKGPHATFKPGFAMMYDASGFSQDDTSKQQVGDLAYGSKIRDLRFIFSGTFPKIPWLVQWKAGFMHDVPNDEWLVRETGLIVKVPHLSGHVFIGRTKEGTSITKHMVGFAVWGLERSPWHDATIPVMADGIRWMGYRPDKHLVWNLGLFNETILEGHHYPFQDRQALLRVAWLPYLAPDSGKLVHLGLNLRYAEPEDGKTQLKARPENNVAPYFVDTGVFPAKHTELVGPEVFYRNGSWIVGSEYYWMKTEAPEGDHHFNGGDVVATWLMTGEVRPYSTRGGVFGFVQPKQSVFEGGKGAWEAILRFSYIDTDSGTIRGGQMWRISPLIAWHLSGRLRWTVGYGYGVLDRFGEKGGTHFLQSRISFML